ncbi:MAG: protoheme IX farnesyltransferase [Bacteroidetes bacterium]|nr:protoheme IX farnesyltransferase [Bacteroidota bacterium]
MEKINSHITAPEQLSKQFFKDYFLLSKFRLSTTVVGTTLICYFLGIQKFGISISWSAVFGLALGGMLVTAAANGFNQIWEKDLDKLMSRTQDRPLANGRMKVNDALVFSSVCAALGLFLLAYAVNGRVALLSLLSLFTYALVYTPLKKETPLAVFVGAIPGALPPAIGWVAVSGNIDSIAYILFAVQFFWQFPHFWAIAWILEDDYRKAGYTLLPSYAGRTKKNALQTVWYSAMLILVTLYPISLGDFSSPYSLFLILPAGGFLLFKSYKLYQEMTVESAKKLMYASLIYMPAVLISYFF